METHVARQHVEASAKGEVHLRAGMLENALVALDAHGMSTGDEMASSTFAKNCFFASKAVPESRILVRVWAWAPSIAQT